jgi:hypothetical protein
VGERKVPTAISQPHSIQKPRKESGLFEACGVGMDSEYSTSEAFSASSPNQGADEEGEGGGVIYLAFKYAASIFSSAARICFTEARP